MEFIFATGKIFGLILTSILVSLALAPQNIFFLIAFGIFVLAGIWMLGYSIAWGVGFIIIGLIAGFFGVRLTIQLERGDSAEQKRTEETVRRRFGGIPEDWQK